MTGPTVPCSKCGKPKCANKAADCRACYKARDHKDRAEAPPKLTVAQMDELQRAVYDSILGSRKDASSQIEARRMVEIATERTKQSAVLAFMPALWVHSWIPKIDDYLAAEINWQVARRPLAVHRSSLTVAMDQAAWG